MAVTWRQGKGRGLADFESDRQTYWPDGTFVMCKDTGLAYILSGGEFYRISAIPVINQTEIDFGDTPVAEATFIVSDGDVAPSSRIIAQVAWEAPAGKDLDEVEMDDLLVRCQPGTGQFSMLVRAADGSYLEGKFKINYQVGA